MTVCARCEKGIAREVSHQPFRASHTVIRHQLLKVDLLSVGRYPTCGHYALLNIKKKSPHERGLLIGSGDELFPQVCKTYRNTQHSSYKNNSESQEAIACCLVDDCTTNADAHANQEYE